MISHAVQTHIFQYRHNISITSCIGNASSTEFGTVRVNHEGGGIDFVSCCVRSADCHLACSEWKVLNGGEEQKQRQ